ncbi:MAG: Gfo/Idh/MocA family oxidoreductase [Lachnospiraceae bacterium]|nr:Gfo/Idh/MocA family oxidoreductase [Lachnospiraceae bacterium]
MNLAILGAGRIAISMATTVSQMEEVHLYAVAARDGARAKAFAEKYGVEKSYGSYEEMLCDEQVDLVYIATPHSLHCEQAKLCIAHGKPVLCEKAFAMNARETREMLDYAHEKGVFIAEAMWARYTPQAQKLRELACGIGAGTTGKREASDEEKCPGDGSSRPQGRIGTIVGLTANLGYQVMNKERLIRPELGGGALLDLGVYTMNFATWILGDDVQSLTTSMVPLEADGDISYWREPAAVSSEKKAGTVDKSEFINLVYPDGTIAGLFNTMEAVTDRRGIIFGTEGRIEVENVNNFGEIRIYNNRYELVETIPQPQQISGYEYEVLACKRALEQGKLECEEMPHAHTLRVMELLDEIRSEWE